MESAIWPFINRMAFANAVNPTWRQRLGLEDFTFRWPIVGIVAAIVIIALWAVASRWAKKQTYLPSDDMPPTWTLQNDMSGHEVDSRYRTWLRANRASVIILAAIGLICAGVCARPGSITTDDSEASRRDIVLCLDVSGSTLPYDAKILETYRNISSHFNGERIGLSIFNSTSRVVFPLTDDYEIVDQQLSYASGLLDKLTNITSVATMSDDDYQKISDWLEGTMNITDASSLIGDGLVNCAVMLPEFTLNDNRGVDASTQDDSSKRVGMIMLATDNLSEGTGVYTLEEAMDLATNSNIAVDGLYAGDSSQVNSSEAAEMENLITKSGGIYEAATTQEAVDNLVRDIDTRSTGVSRQDVKSDIRDTPILFVVALALLWLAYLGIEGALRR
ncbi:MAG: VWA domain-containing protein [Bifidobacteriaceae bacterium]|nr:VWA domain-containing protein [Bifidobacteriaceae bacterium]